MEFKCYINKVIVIVNTIIVSKKGSFEQKGKNYLRWTSKNYGILKWSVPENRTFHGF